MKKQVPNNLIMAIATVVLGVLFIVLKGEVISIAMTVLGVALIVAAVIDFVNKKLTEGVIKAVLGAVVIICGWAFVKVALYIMAAVLLIYGILQLIEAIKATGKKSKVLNTVWRLVEPVLTIIIAVCLIFNQGGAVEWLFIVAGVILIIEGMVSLINYLKAKK